MATPILNSAWRRLVDLVFPRACLGCQGPLLRNEGLFCEECRTQLAAARSDDYCRRCGATVPPFGETSEGCSHCRGVCRRTVGIVRFAAYESALGEWLCHLKYEQRDELQFMLAELLANVIQEASWRSHFDVLTFVPTCWQHQLFRRTHVTTLLAPLVAKKVGVPMLPLLRRVRGGPHQVGLTERERATNIRGAFKPAKGIKMNQTRVCLIDDVTTTGATLAECTQVLLESGASCVYAAVLAKASAGGHFV